MIEKDNRTLSIFKGSVKAGWAKEELIITLDEIGNRCSLGLLREMLERRTTLGQ